MRTLITGGTGFIGRSLVKSLVEDGHNVASFDNDSRGHKETLAGIDCEIINSDIRDVEAVTKAVQGCDRVYHLAYINGTEAFYRIPDVILDVAVKGMANVIDACKRENVPEISLASSSEAYQTPTVVPTPEDVQLVVPNPLNPRYSYGGGKIISELMLLNNSKYFEKVTLFRPHNIYGPNMGDAHVVPQLCRKVYDQVCLNQTCKEIRVAIQGTGNETRSFCYIDDAVDGIKISADKGETRGIYNVGTEDEITIRELVERIAAEYDRDVVLIPGKLQDGGTVRRCPDISKLKALGYSPKVSLQSGLKRCILR